MNLAAVSADLMTAERRPIGIYYEHPQWFRPLFAELDKRAIPYVQLDAAHHQYDAGAREEKRSDGVGSSVVGSSDGMEDYALLFNRMSASAYLRGHGNAVFYTGDYLEHMESRGVRVINGSRAYALEISKARQLALLARLGLSFPRTRVVNHVREIPSAARDFRFPVVVKPNIGGRGAGIVRFDTAEGLRRWANEPGNESGSESGSERSIDGTWLVQEFVPARGGFITRVETLGGRFLYAIKVYTTGESFNLCPAEICQVEDATAPQNEMCLVDAPKAGLKVEAFMPPAEIVEAVERIAAAAHLDVGGVEYLTDDRNGKPVFYDINALSNFVADALSIVGFDPHARLVDYLQEEYARCATVTGSRFSAAG